MGKYPVLTTVSLGLLLAFGALAYDYAWVYPHLAHCRLEVRLQPTGMRQVVRVWTFLLFAPRSEAETIQGNLRRGVFPSQEFKLNPVEGFDGDAFTQEVDYIEMKSTFGRTLHSYPQPKLLVIKVEFADGDTQFFVVTIPAGRGDRSVTVPVP
jgi:hypothetical protein